MNVLGLHGVYPRSHDSSACLIEDQAITAYAEEERFARSKRAFDLQPHNAITYALQSTETNVDQIDAITYGWRGDNLTAQDILPEQYVSQLTREIPVVQIQHHEAHAASVFYTSPFTESAVLVADGQGEDESSTLWLANETGLTKLATFDTSKSLGYLYAAVSNYCGLGSFGAGKIMGLAPYGEPRYVRELAAIYHAMKLPEQTGHDSQDAFFAQFLGKMYAQGFPEVGYSYNYDPATNKTRKMPNLDTIHCDMAASVQALLEQEMMGLAEQARNLTGSENLCLAGGVAMNCVTNSVIQDSGLFENIFVQPGCEDSGVSMGSALAFTKQKIPLETPYTGPWFGDPEIGSLLKARGIYAFDCDDIAAETAKLLAGNNVVGWFQGGLEFGPRALGNRSILANPGTVKTRDRVNDIKSREPWRPFGPSVLAEDAPDLFERSYPSPYMLRSFQVQQVWRERLAAIVHVDGSTRPQTVERDQNPRFYDLIKTFGRLTGLPAVLNTSFNSYDEPIVATPDDALRTFNTTGLDALVLGRYLITKHSRP